MLNIKLLTVGRLQSNCYILYNADSEAVLIDPGADFNLIDRYIFNNNLDVKAIIFTHGHFDHIGAGQELCEKYLCNVYVHKNDVPLLFDSSLNLSCHMCEKDVVFKKDVISVVDESVSILGCEFTFIHTPGHSPGSMCIVVDGVLFTGDTLFKLSVGNSFPPYGNMSEEIDSIIKKIYSLDDMICYPGHGEATSIEYEKKFNPYTKGETWI